MGVMPTRAKGGLFKTLLLRFITFLAKNDYYPLCGRPPEGRNIPRFDKAAIERCRKYARTQRRHLATWREAAHSTHAFFADRGADLFLWCRRVTNSQRILSLCTRLRVQIHVILESRALRGAK